MTRLELGFGNAGTHSGRRRCSTRCHIDGLINEFGAAPALMLEQFDLILAFLALDALDVGEHTLVGKGSGQFRDNEAVAVKASQGDELPDVAQTTEVVVKVGHVLVRHATGIPVEGWRQIVGQHLVRDDRSDALAELSGIGNGGNLGLHPNQVGVGAVGNGALNAIVNSSL